MDPSDRLIESAGLADAGATPVAMGSQHDRYGERTDSRDAGSGTTARDVPDEVTDSLAANLTDSVHAEAAVAPAPAGTMRAAEAGSTNDDDEREWTIEVGADVIGTCGHKVGEVVAVRPRHVVVEKGFFMPSDFYIPKSAIGKNNDHGLYLNVTKEQALHHGWDVDPDGPGRP